jgi:4-azaleucine resistance transporter AzlC
VTGSTTGSYRDGARSVAPLAVAAASFGAAFGVLAQAAGMGVLAPIVMSATTFAGAAQFAAASVLDEGGGVVAAVAAAVLLNARYAAIGIAVAPDFKGSPLRRMVESQLIVDESWAVAQVGHGRINQRVLVGAGLVLFPFWVGGTALGVLFGDVLGDPERFGLDAAFPALFLALLATQLVNRRTVLAAVAGGVIAFVLIPIAPPGVPVVAASAVCLAGLTRR